MLKRNNGILLKIGMWVLVTVFAAGGIYTAVHYRLNDVETDVVEVEKEVKAIDTRVTVIDKVVIVIKTDLGYIKRDIAEQKTLTKEILKEVRK